jgi:LmbE family N-acetylglucosaminyl deacetylase
MNKLLVISAHSADFVWRSGGTIAKSVEQGAETLVVCLSFGERGESGELWKEDPKRSEESVKIIRKAQAQQAAVAAQQQPAQGDMPPTVDAVAADVARKDAWLRMQRAAGAWRGRRSVG